MAWQDDAIRGSDADPNPPAEPNDLFLETDPTYVRTEDAA